MKFFIAVFTIGLFATKAYSYDVCLALFNKHDETGTMRKFGSSPADNQFLHTKLSVLIWNIQKMKHRRFYQAFEALAHQSDLILIQEAVHHPDFIEFASSKLTDFSWTMTSSHILRGGFDTGVATAAKSPAVFETALISPGREPVLKTPKTTLISEYKLRDREDTLLVVNIHGINFVRQRHFEDQILQIVQAILEHEGPLLMAGDFNTWSRSRFRFLQITLEELGLSHVASVSRGAMTLDHLFVRGIALRRQQLYEKPPASDHSPLIVDLEVLPQAE